MEARTFFRMMESGGISPIFHDLGVKSLALASIARRLCDLKAACKIITTDDCLLAGYHFHSIGCLQRVREANCISG